MDFICEQNRIYANDVDGKLIAEVTFPDVTNGTVNINHTFVDDSLRGQGIANQLLKAAALQIRTDNKKAYPTCSYAVKWFEKNEDFKDIYISNLWMD